ncbi:MAG TPA: hypothetical protein VF889_01325 [Bacteroidota bacterium]
MARTGRTSHGISFYFVLYLVAIITVFVITSERDSLLRKRDEDIARLVEIYIKPLHLSPAVDTVRYFLPANQKVTQEPLKLLAKAEGPIDKNDIRYSLLNVRKISGGGSALQRGGPAADQGSGTFTNDHGDGVLSFPPLGEGVYEFTVTGYKPRVIRQGSTMRVAIRDTSYVIQYSDRLNRIDRDTTVLIASVIKTGLEPTQMTLSTERPRETWVVGLPYRKRLFIAGVESPDRVSFDAPMLRVERSPGERSFVTLVWDNPSLGPRTFQVHGSGNRGLGEKDHASTTFTVDVVPAAFATPPAARAFWEIPYIFDGQIAGINPIDLTVELQRDGTPAWTRPAVPRDTVIPDRSWHAMTFRILYQGSLIKEHHASVEAPPPPQIRWVNQELDHDRSALIVTVACTDPAGGPVQMSLESQPGGIARLDRIRGTRFTITVSLAGKPAGVFLKLSAVDQYGGQANSSRQFTL